MRNEGLERSSQPSGSGQSLTHVGIKLILVGHQGRPCRGHTTAKCIKLDYKSLDLGSRRVLIENR